MPYLYDYGIRERAASPLPVVLSLEEITTFFESIARLKQRTILMTAYAAGLRVSEIMHRRSPILIASVGQRLPGGSAPVRFIALGSHAGVPAQP
jgi:site-specific recombinase XerD